MDIDLRLDKFTLLQGIKVHLMEWSGFYWLWAVSANIPSCVSYFLDKCVKHVSDLSLSLVLFLLTSAKCEDIMFSYCTDMTYTQTMFPNTLGHRAREEAEASAEYMLMSVAETLLGGECNPDIRMLGCSVLSPRCEKAKLLKPCRSTCEEVHKKCSHVFDGIDMAWPYFLDCDRFFFSEEEGCYDPLVGLKGEEIRWLLLLKSNFFKTDSHL